MNYILFSHDNVVGSIGLHLKDEGNSVVLGIVDDPKLIATQEEMKGVKPEDPDSKKRRLGMFKGLLKTTDAVKLLKAMKKIENKDDYFVMSNSNNAFRFLQKAQEMGFTKGLFATEEQRLMETDRNAAKEIVKKHYPDLKVGEVFEFKKAEEGINFLQDSDKTYVLKSQGDSGETFCSKSEDPKTANGQVIALLQKDSKAYEQNGYILEEKIMNGIELTPEAVWWNGELVYTVLDIETKTMGAGEKGINVGCRSNLLIKTDPEDKINKMAFPPYVHELAKKQKGMFIMDAALLFDKKGDAYFLEYCFSSDTEVLTDSGWKTYKEMLITDKVLSLNPKTRELEWKPITRIVIKPHNGEMVKIKSIDALVTPDHHLWFDNGEVMKKFRAKDLPHTNNWKLPRTGIWNGNNIPEIVLPEIVVSVPEREVNKGVFIKGGGKLVDTNYAGDRKYSTKISKVKSFVRHTLPELKFKTEDFCYLLGLWIAEGTFGGYYKGEPRSIHISQSMNNPKRIDMERRIKGMGLKYGVSKNGTFNISNRRLAKYLWDELGLKHTHADTKFIPKFFKELTVSCLNELLMGYMAGDGSFHKNQWVCSTVSKRLADDLQEITHKLGWVANIKFQASKGTKFTIDGKTYTRRHDSYRLTTKHQKTSTVAFSKNLSTEQYDGIVWDVTVADNESLMVRRNGNAFISSNCANRLGWDSFPTEVAMSGDRDGERIASPFFENLIKGKNPLKTRFGAGIRLFNQNEDSDRHPEQDLPITVDDKSKPDTYLYDVMEKDGQIVSAGYQIDLAVSTGASDNLKEAIDRCYEYAEGVGFKDVLYAPKDDFLSVSYTQAILNRLKWGVEHGLFKDEGILASIQEIVDSRLANAQKELEVKMKTDYDSKLSEESGKIKDKYDSEIRKVKKAIKDTING